MKNKAFVGLLLTLGIVLALSSGAASASPSSLPNGYTAKIVAVSGQTITGTINARGYGLGIYVGPGVTNVTVRDAVVTNANDEGILVQDTSNVRIVNSVVEGNAIRPFSTQRGTETKGVALVGTTGVLVKGNTVEANGHGGIGIYDDGANSPFAPIAIDTESVAGEHNVIVDNLVKNNGPDCGIVVSAKNPGGGVSHNVVSKNSVTTTAPSGGVGGIVVAGGVFGPVTLKDNMILDNEVAGGMNPGIVLHAFGPGNISGTKLIGNVLSHNGEGEISGSTTGIELFAVPQVGVITGTQILSETISNDHFGVWHGGDSGTHTAHLTTDGVALPSAP